VLLRPKADLLVLAGYIRVCLGGDFDTMRTGL